MVSLRFLKKKLTPSTVNHYLLSTSTKYWTKSKYSILGLKAISMLQMRKQTEGKTQSQAFISM